MIDVVLIVVAAWLALSFVLTVSWCAFVEVSHYRHRRRRARGRSVQVMPSYDREIQVSKKNQSDHKIGPRR